MLQPQPATRLFRCRRSFLGLLAAVIVVVAACRNPFGADDDVTGTYDLLGLGGGTGLPAMIQTTSQNGRSGRLDVTGGALTLAADNTFTLTVELEHRVEGVLQSAFTEDTAGTYTYHGQGRIRFDYAGGYEPTTARSGNIRMGFPVWGYPIPGVEHHPRWPMGLFVRKGSRPTPY